MIPQGAEFLLNPTFTPVNRLSEHPRGPGFQPPAPLQQWLCNPNSLTDALIHASSGRFRVQVLGQTIARPRPAECEMLKLAYRRRALIREVLLLGRGEPWVYARSVLPLETLRGRFRYLRHLGERPLGACLFAEPDLQRGPIQIFSTPAQSLELPSIADNTLVWGRASTFFLRRQALVVSEVFLPSFEAICATFQPPGIQLC